MNDGDWVESCTALVEHFDGTFEIVTWNEIKETKEDRCEENIDNN
jgi:hypothetical protein